MAAGDERMNIYRAARSIKRRENSLHNSLRSIYEDSVFVAEIAQLWPELPLLANLRCGLWYSSRFDSTCYFKSTDGHNTNWSFNTSRLNLHVATLAGQRGGCIIVDSTRKGKRFPDSMSKTIPIWACVLNRAIENRLRKLSPEGELESKSSPNEDVKARHMPLHWDSSLHLPLWVSVTEKAAIEDHLDEWTKQLEDSGADIDSLTYSLGKPLRPLWISQRTVIWLNEVPASDSWDFTPIILVSASSSNGISQHSSISDFSWQYIPGAGDDEESWARGLSANLFWTHAFELISLGPDLCNQKVAELVEKDRVYRVQRGEFAPQITTKLYKSFSNKEDMSSKLSDTKCQVLNFASPNDLMSTRYSVQHGSLAWIGLTNLAVCTTLDVENVSKDTDCVLNCDPQLISFRIPDANAYLHLPIVTSKFDRFSLLNSLPAALNFAKLNLKRGRKLLVCCHNGEDISVCVCLAILTCLFDDAGFFGDGRSFANSSITKWEIRKRLVFICKFVTSARPSRGNIRQVFLFSSRQTLITADTAVADAV